MRGAHRQAAPVRGVLPDRSALAGRAGDDSLADLLDRHATSLRNALAARRAADDAEDLVQDSFVQLLEAGRWQDIADRQAWLHQVGVRLVADSADRQRERDEVDTAEVLTDTVADRHADPALILDAQQQAERLSEALQALPSACRQVFLLNRLEGLSRRLIAVRLGMTERAVDRHMLRALATCRDAMQAPRRR